MHLSAASGPIRQVWARRVVFRTVPRFAYLLALDKVCLLETTQEKEILWGRHSEDLLTDGARTPFSHLFRSAAGWHQTNPFPQATLQPAISRHRSRKLS